MKYIICASLILQAVPVHSEVFTGKNIVEFKSHAGPYLTEGNVWSDVTWISISGVTEVGTECKPTSWSNGLAPFYIKHENTGLYTLALAAKMADKIVNVNVNTIAPKIEGACKLEYLGI